MTWEAYGEELDVHLHALHDRVHSGAYRALPSLRVEIPKPDGGTRPLGIAALEDKIVRSNFPGSAMGSGQGAGRTTLWTLLPTV